MPSRLYFERSRNVHFRLKMNFDFKFVLFRRIITFFLYSYPKY